MKTPQEFHLTKIEHSNLYKAFHEYNIQELQNKLIEESLENKENLIKYAVDMFTDEKLTLENAKFVTIATHPITDFTKIYHSIYFRDNLLGVLTEENFNLTFKPTL